MLDDRLDDVLLTYNLTQHVQVSTHELGHVLDLIITMGDVIDLISNVNVSSHCISDHSLVACIIKMRREKQAKHTYCYRNIMNIDLDTFKSSIRFSRLYDTSLFSLSADEYTDVFDNDVRRRLDEAAPIRTAVKRPALNDCRWMSDEVRAAKRNCRRLERRYFQTRNDTDRRAYRAAQRTAILAA